MDYFSLGLEILCLAGLSVMHMTFSSRLTGKKQRAWHLFVYFLLLCILELLSLAFAIPGSLTIGAGAAALYAMNRLALKNKRPASWTAAIFAVYISQLSFGIINSAEMMLFPHLIGKPLLYGMVLFATMAAFFVCACCYGAIRKLLSLDADSQTPYLGLLLFPGLFFFAAELYLLHTSYRISVSSLSLPDTKNLALLSLQVMGLGALFCTLYAYRHLCRGFQAQAALQSLTQAAQAQKIYIAEAQMRYEQTKSFRHDIKNHFAVLDGLLHSGKWEEGRKYLKKLRTVSDTLSFPCQTGNPVVDILLGEKLGLARASGIDMEVSLLLPKFCGIDDLDLCVIFANALDNAICACQAGEGAKHIRIAGKQQGDFYLLSFENTCSGEPLPPAGTGLSNIQSAAKKYHGTMLTEKEGTLFSLNVLLNISLHSENASIPKV